MKYRDQISQLIKPNMLFIVMIGLITAAELFALGALSYLGTHYRYMADDYCESVLIRNEPVLTAVFHRYVDGDFRASNRYSNLLFVGLSEVLGKNSVQILPTLMILALLVGMTWSLNQFLKLTGIRLPGLVVYWAAVSVVFFSAWQAPNRFQIFFWRSGMATHFAPIVFISLFSGFVLYQICSANKPALWISFAVFLASFMIGGFSEPPAVFMVVLIILSMVAVWRWKDVSRRRSVINLLGYSLAGTCLALIAMFFAPGNLTHGTSSLAYLVTTLGKTFKFTFEFLIDTVKTLPLPTLITFFTPFLVSFGFFIKPENQSLPHQSNRQTWIWILLILLTQYLLITASFAPSAYGQSYPAERARFLGRVIMTVALMLEGALLGVLCARYSVILSRRTLFSSLSVLTLFLLAFYPLRAGFTLLTEVPEYRNWASAWDLRETKIYNDIEMGEQDLVVKLLSSREGVKEIDANTRHWVNRCTAEFYGVNTIRSIPMENE
jgi:hypothetical protein